MEEIIIEYILRTRVHVSIYKILINILIFNDKFSPNVMHLIALYVHLPERVAGIVMSLSPSNGN